MDGQEMLPVENLLSYSFIIQGKVGRGEDFLCLSGVDGMLPSSTSPPSWAGEFSYLYMAKLGPQIIIIIIIIYVCREHVLGIINLLSSLGRM